MIGFLTPAALAALGLLASPIILHLFKPRKVRQTPFSSLRWLRASQHRLSRRIKWHQIILFLLRAGLIIFLVLALAKPILSLTEGARFADRFIVLDVGRTMGAAPENAASPLERARQATGQLAEHVVAGDRTALILAGARSEALGPLQGDATGDLPAARARAASLGESNLSDSLGLVRSMLAGGRSDVAVDLFFVTDMRAGKWSQGPIHRFVESTDRPIRVNLVDVGLDGLSNAWIAEARMAEVASPRRRLIHVSVGAAGHEAQRRRVTLGGLPGLTEQRESVVVEPGRLETISFEIPSEYDLAGRVATLSLDPQDALPSDDLYWLNLDATGAMQVLVVEPDITQVDELQPGFHLRTALGALSNVSQGSLVVNRRSPTDVLGPAIAEADVIFMVDVPRLSPGDQAALEQRVAGGAGLVMFLGPGVDRDYYSRSLHNPLRPSESLLAMPVGEPFRPAPDRAGLAPMQSVRLSHPIFEGLFDPIFGDAARVGFSTAYQLAMPEQGAEALAWITPDVPAIVERSLGSGRILLMNTTADDRWTDLPRRRTFVPLIDRTLRYLAGRARRGMFEAGETVSMPLPLGANADSVTIQTPQDQSMTPAVRQMAGRPVMQIEGLETPGVYRVTYTTGAGREAFPFVMQASRSQSGLQRVNLETLTAWWGDAQVRTVTADDAGRITLADERFVLEWWLILAACACFLAEMLLVHWLCPKMNPTVTSRSVIGRTGFFDPGDGDDAGDAGARAPVTAQA